jgi:Sec-independent protein secretion pathway component TatC
VKEVLKFIRWQWRKWETWQKGYIIGAFFMGAGVVAPNPYDLYLLAIPMIVLFVHCSKWMVWDQVKASWNKYKTEKQELFPSIKDSHK